MSVWVYRPVYPKVKDAVPWINIPFLFSRTRTMFEQLSDAHDVMNGRTLDCCSTTWTWYSEALLRIAGEMEYAMRNRGRLYGAVLQSFRERFQEITVHTFRRVFFSDNLQSTNMCVWMSQPFLEHHQFLRRVLQATKGIMQVCPMSVLVLNALVEVCPKVLSDEVHSFSNQRFVDDVILLTHLQSKLHWRSPC